MRPQLFWSNTQLFFPQKEKQQKLSCSHVTKNAMNMMILMGKKMMICCCWLHDWLCDGKPRIGHECRSVVSAGLQRPNFAIARVVRALWCWMSRKSFRPVFQIFLNLCVVSHGSWFWYFSTFVTHISMVSGRPTQFLHEHPFSFCKNNEFYLLLQCTGATNLSAWWFIDMVHFQKLRQRPGIERKICAI